MYNIHTFSSVLAEIFKKHQYKNYDTSNKISFYKTNIN